MDDLMKFNSCLQQISRELSSDELEYLKFLCECVIPDSSRAIERVDSGVDLFSFLTEKSKLSSKNLVFLTSILTSIGRECLLNVCTGFSSSAVTVSTPQPQRDYMFAECLVKIAQSLVSKDMGELLYLLGPKFKVPVPTDRIASPTKLFLELKKQLLLSETKTYILQDALRQIGRLDLANRIDDFLKVTGQRPSSNEQALYSHGEAYVPSEGQIPLHTASGSECEQPHKEVERNINKLQEDFVALTNCIEDSLKKNDVSLEVIMKRFRVLSPSIRTQQQMDEAFSGIRHRTLESKTIKQLFDNLTELKCWNFMTPEILTYIIRDVKEVHFDVAVYESKLLDFKTNTKVRDLIGLQFLLPAFYIQLNVKVLGWKEKTIRDAEKSVHRLLVQAGYQDPRLLGGLQGVKHGCIELAYVLLDSIDTSALSNKELFDMYEANGIISISVDQIIVYSKEQISPIKGVAAASTSDGTEMPGRPVDWYGTGSIAYSAQGGRDVLIIESDLPLPHPETTPRRSAQLTDDNRQKLKSQGVSSDDLDEASIIRQRYECDKRRTLFRVLRSEPGHQLHQGDVIESITELFSGTKNDGAVIYYIGAGRKNTGDWCFEDGVITFRDITELYLRASPSFKGRVLTIVSDCSYSGCWVRDCMEFLDLQGVQPCGHKAREKGILIKVYASCGPTQIPTQYQFSVHGASNDRNKGHMFSYTSKQLLDTQHTYSVNSSVIRCRDSEHIEDTCLLQSDCTWQKWRKREHIQLIVDVDESHSRPTWQYVLLDDNETKVWEFKEKRGKGEPIDVTEYGRILESGWGKEPSNEVKHEIEREYHLWHK